MNEWMYKCATLFNIKYKAVKYLLLKLKQTIINWKRFTKINK